MPRKLVEIAFRRLWILLVPVVFVPVAVVALQDNPTRYESSAVIWVANPPGGEPTVGVYNPYLSPSANQVNALNDLLATESFRGAVAKDAGLPAAAGTAEPFLPTGQVFSYSRGVNLLVVQAKAERPELAQALVRATITQFSTRAAEQAQLEADYAGEYYRQQIAVADQELNDRRRAVDDYIRAHPSAATPGSAASLSFDYQTAVTRAADQARVVADLQSRLQDVELKLVAAPQNLAATFAVQDEPNLPSAPVAATATKRFGYPVAGLLLGVFIAASYLYMVYRTDHTVLSSEDLAGLNVQLLGRVPELRQRTRIGAIPLISRLGGRRNRDFARHTASAISSDGGQRA